MVTPTIATNGERSYVKGPWLYEAGNNPLSITNMFVWTNRAVFPCNFFIDGSSYNLSQTTNCWEITNANYQFISKQMPIPGPDYSWFFIMRVYESQNSVGYNYCGPEVGGELNWCQWVDDPATGYWISETIAGASSHINAVGMTNMYLYFTGIEHTNLGQTLLFLYTNTAADMSGTWGLVGTASNHTVLGAGTGTTLFDIGRMDVHGNVALSKADFIMAGVDTNYAHFPLGPNAWTNAWAPNITSVVATPGSTTCALTWTTDQSADSKVNYGTTSAYGSSTSDSSKVRSHTINLSGLSTSTTYHYNVVSVNGSGLSASTTDATFATSSGANNIVEAQHWSMGDGNSAATIGSGSKTVTAGNDIIVGVALFAQISLTSGMLTKTAGTATIGTIFLDKANNDSVATTVGIYRAHVTGSGTLTFTFNPGSTYYMLGGGAEFSGMASSPLGTPGSNSGSGTTLTTGSVTSNLGIIWAVGSNNPNNNFTWGATDTVVFSVGTGGSTGTGLIEYKVVNSSPNTLSPNTGADSEAWNIVWAPYSSN